MKSRVRQSVVTSLLLAAIAVVAVNVWLALRAVRVLEASEITVAETWQLIDAVDNVLSSVKDAETGNRGFLAAHDRAYLEPYLRARAELPGELNRIEQMVRGMPAQQQRVAVIRAVIEDRLALLEQGIAEEQNGNHDSLRELVLSGTGKLEMDRLRALTAEMQNGERALLAERTRASAQARRRAQWTLLLASLLDLALIMLLFWTLARERAQREAATQTAERLRELQVITDVGLTQLTVSELTSELLRRLRGAIAADGLVFCLWQEGEMVVTCADGLDALLGLRFWPSQADPVYRSLMTGEIIRLTEKETSALPLESVRRQMHAVLLIPLTMSGRPIGLLVAGRRGEDGFQHQDEQLLAFAADRIAISLDRAHAYEAERGARRAAEASAAEVAALNVELEQRVRLRTAELELTNRELEAFSYSVSHDLRAPLRTIDGFSQALEEDLQDGLPPEAKSYLGRIRAGVQRMGTLIDALLQLSRITRSEITPETFDLTALVEEVAADLSQAEPRRHVEFRIARGLSAHGDIRLVRVAIENLLGNALKFTLRRDHTIIEVGRNEQTGEFYIRDNGAGFDMQYVDKLFTAFQRLHGDKDFTGSGIGLATVFRVIRRHGGSIRAEGAVDHGATFYFRLG